MVNACFKVKSNMSLSTCEQGFVEKLYETESLMVLAIDNVFLETTHSQLYTYLRFLLDCVQNIRTISEQLLSMEVKSPEPLHQKLSCFYINTHANSNTLTHFLLDLLFKTESLANIGNQYLFLEECDTDKTNFFATVTGLLSQLRELFEQWLLYKGEENY